MKRCCIIVFLLAFTGGLLSLSAQEGSMYEKPFVHNDTTFFLREYSGCGWNKIYIETNRGAYKRLKDFRFDQYDTDTYKSCMDAVRKEVPGGFKAFDLGDLPRRWLPLCLVNNRFYLYEQEGDIGKVILDEFTYISWNMDGPMPSPIRHVEGSGNRYTIDIYSPKAYGGDGKTERMNIYIVEPTYGIAVWEYLSSDGSKSYRLYLPAKNADYFKAIMTTAEFCKPIFSIPPEQPDFEALIANMDNL